MLTNTFRVLVNNLFKESFYGKRKKKRVQNQVENVGKVKDEGRTLKGYFGHVIKCAIFYAPLTL